MKVNSMMIVVAVAIVGATSGCCWLGCGSCKKDDEKCCKKACGIGVNATVGSASAGAGVSTRDIHAEAQMGK